MLSADHSTDHKLYVDHSPKEPPSPASTRFVCMSDTHSHSFVVPPGDVLLHAGDLSSWGQVSQLKKTIDWLASLPHPVKMSIIAGNHDLCLDNAWETDMKAAQDLVRGPAARKAGIYYLEHESLEFVTARGHHWKVYGSPAAPRHADGAFQYLPGAKGREIYDRIPADTDILLTHTPPYRIHDLTKHGKHAGCKDLAEKLLQLEGCALHVFGHIHEAHGASVHNGPHGTRVQVNAALAWHGEPIVVDLHNKTMDEPIDI
ncbi:Metallo-dependent phosphatase [Ramaria rubella]|nr:Metallo-dependent phosphatase [Ramaria rubella]